MMNRSEQGIGSRAGSDGGASLPPIAIIGIGCRFPGGASDPNSFWNNLVSGVDAIVPIPDDRWNLRQFHDPQRSRPGKTRTGRAGLVDHLDQFDPQFFGISPCEAARMDPQQRMLLEVAWEAIEDGGQCVEHLAGSRTAVFVGISSWDYAYQGMSHEDRAAIDAYSNTGCSLSIASNRISYCFDLRGPSLSVDTACSSALVALHLACRGIWSDGCPLALAGGVNALLMPDFFVAFSQLGMLSPDGRCHAFDARANGFVRGEGAGMVLLKPLPQARSDGDRIYAVIRGTAVNQDGRTPGLTVPREAAQQALLREACRAAGVSPGAIQYVEAHGTGTAVGDPIEVRALGNALAEQRPPGRPCLVGSVKTNIGHLEAGAGIASVIKVALAIHHRAVPGNLHFERPNPDIDFERLGLRIPVTCQPWPGRDGVRLAGVNGFGYGGTNAHVILQNGPDDNHCDEPTADTGRAELVPLSARSPEALRALAERSARLVDQEPDVATLGELAGHAAHRRSHHEFRLAAVASSPQDLSAQWTAFAAEQLSPTMVANRCMTGERTALTFICSGQGPQWWAMGRELLEREPVFRDIIERCDRVSRELGSWSLREELNAEQARSRMMRTAIAQPAIFAVQAGLGELWRHWGISPDLLVGHSVGEIAAAYLAGVFSLEDAFRVVYHRGRCMDLASSRGRMLAAGLSEQEALEIVADRGAEDVALAAINSPSSVTLSGSARPLERVAEQLERRGIFHRWLKVEYAFHSAQMDPVRDELVRSLSDIRPGRADVPLVSTVTGDRVKGPELGADYWWRNVRQTVRFASAVARIAEQDSAVALELSPHPALAYSVAECYQHAGKPVRVLASLCREEPERATMLRALGELYTLGYPVDWNHVVARPRRFVRFPGYPWQRQRCWFETSQSRRTRLAGPVHPLLGASQGGPLATWQNRVDVRQLPYLADHRVQGAIVLPAAAFLELALAAAREVHGQQACRVDKLKLVNPCLLAAEESRWLETRYVPEDRALRVDSRPADDVGDWILHAAAELPRHDPDPSAADNDFRPEEIQRRCAQQFSRESCYAFLERLGLDYGESFRGIANGWRRDGEALAMVEMPGEPTRELDEYMVHPALLDACFHAVVAADGDFELRNSGLYLPSDVEQVTCYTRPTGRVWCHARLRKKTSRSLLADLDVRNEGGELVLQIRGFRSRRVTQGDADENVDDLFYRYVWRPQPLATRPDRDDSAEDPKRAESPRWLIFADRTGIANDIVSHLSEAGEEFALVYSGDAYCREEPGRYRIDAGERDDMLQLLRDIAEDGPSACRGIVHLWNLDTPLAATLQPEECDAVMDGAVMSVLNLVQAWDAVLGDRSASLFLVTRGAQSVGAEPELAAVAQNPVIGFGRVIVSEYPPLRCKLIDLDPADRTGGESLIAELTADDEEDEVAWRGGGRYVHRYVPVAEHPLNVRRGGGKSVPYRLVVDARGTIEGLALRTVRRTVPAAGEVEISVTAAALNFSDVMKTLGLYPGLPDGPVALGAECAGVVSRVGEGVGDFQVGDAVVAVAPFAFGSHVLARAELVAAKPRELSFEQATTIPIAFLTAAYALNHLARLEAGESVLIHSATGGVGLAAVQLAQRVGATILATAGTDEKRDYLRQHGIECVMDSRSLAFTSQVSRYTNGRGVDVLLNSLAGEAIPRGLDALAPCGRFLEIGKRDIYGNLRVGLEPFRNNLSFFAIDLDQLMRDRPSLIGAQLRQLMEDFERGRLRPLPYQTFSVDRIADAFRCMRQGKHIGKIVVSMREQPSEVAWGDGDPIAFDPDATYLITGGMGGFGLALAQWLLDRGARSLALMGRRGIPTTEARQVIDRMRSCGARVTILTGDVSRGSDVAAALRSIRTELPPLKGVFHAAMVLEDCLLSKLDRDLMRRVMAPKIEGAWNLHVQTSDLPLDYLVLFSSLSSVFGHAGQANYAAANAFLDGLAYYRRAQRLPCLTINWGYLEDVGYLAERRQLGERLRRQGVHSFSIGEALEALERAMQQEAIQISVMRIDWSRWRGLGVTGHVSPRFAHLIPGSGRGEAGRDRGFPTVDALRDATGPERSALVDQVLRDKVSRLLGVESERLDAGTPLLDLGLDSLMAVELRNWIESQLRVDLPVVRLMRSPSLAVLTEVICDHLDATNEPGESPDVSESRPLPSNVEGLSNQEVDQWLETLLKERDTLPSG